MKIRVDVRGSFPKIDALEVGIPCPKCSTQNKVTLGQIEREETIKCVNCGASIKLTDKDGSVRRGTDEVQQSFDDLERALRKLGQ